ncbi:hypothetical protein AOLI_G00004260 [Acnodon oligacanthus]
MSIGGLGPPAGSFSLPVNDQEEEESTEARLSMMYLYKMYMCECYRLVVHLSLLEGNALVRYISKRRRPKLRSRCTCELL